MDDKAPALDTAEVLNLAIDAEKKSLDEKRAELHSASRDVIKSYKRYSRAKDKVAVKKSTRNLMRLEKSETELGMYIDGYGAAKERMQGALDAVVKAYEKYLEALCLSEDFGSAKRHRAVWIPTLNASSATLTRKITALFVFLPFIP